MVDALPTEVGAMSNQSVMLSAVLTALAQCKSLQQLDDVDVEFVNRVSSYGASLDAQQKMRANTADPFRRGSAPLGGNPGLVPQAPSRPDANPAPVAQSQTEIDRGPEPQTIGDTLSTEAPEPADDEAALPSVNDGPQLLSTKP